MAEVRPIALVGFMACGKSTVGPALAKALGWRFVDVDDAVALLAKRPISEIFHVVGEAGFRDYEYAAVKLLSQSVVAATGGGAFAWPKTHHLLQERTTTVWLHTPLPVLLERLAVDRAHRPLMQGEAWQQTVERLYAERLPWYQKAAVEIKTDHKDVATLVEEIQRCLALTPKV